MSISDSTLFGGLKYCVHYGPIQLTPDGANNIIKAIERMEKEIQTLSVAIAIRDETIANMRTELGQRE